MESSFISILSTEHGRLRREQRDIRKRDLYKALKHGTRERCWGQRWKIEYDGIIFIVNDTMTHEITAYPSPLSKAPVDTKDRILHNRTRDLLHLKPELVTSHTVLVVDVSGSMTTHDIRLHRDRQVAAYSVTAMEYVAEQLFKNTATNSDVVSVIEFSSTATEVFSKEPFSWTLYNKLLERRDSRTYKKREWEGINDCLIGDTNYILALEAADKALSSIDHDRCAISLMFLSDGAPTDARHRKITPLAAKRIMADRIKQMALRHEEKLNIHMIGFGSQSQDFSVLEYLVEAATETQSGTMSEFTYCGKVANKIGSAVSSLVSSTTETRTNLLQNDRGKARTKRKVILESESGEEIHFNYYKIAGHFVYDPSVRDFVPSPDVPLGAVVGGEGSQDCIPNQKRPPPLLAISRLPYGKGAERLAYRCQLAVGADEKGFVYNEMVAKETNLVERPDDNIQFHRAFCEGQNLASYLALQFNHRLFALPWYSEAHTPRIVFLPCSILTLHDPEWPGRGVLVEKRLYSEKHGWKKYNDNAGGLNGQYYHAPIDVEFEFAKMNESCIHDIIEEGSEESSSDEDSESIVDDIKPLCDADGIFNSHDDDGGLDSEEVKPTDYIQAFTHFTYLFTNKQAMVCDLQGVYNSEMVPPTFELTDPAIHYKSKSGKRCVFGRTDLGEAGMNLFFKTHRCNKVCKLMQLSRKNKHWQRQWRGRPL